MGLNKRFYEFVKRHNKKVCEYPVRKVYQECPYFLVIVEPRKDPYFEFVCRTMLRFTNEQWGLKVFHGTDNEKYVKDCLKYVPNVLYTSLGTDNLSIPEYNKLLTSQTFYHSIPSETFIIFQTDSCLLRNGVEEFVMYDFIGAPWPHKNMDVGNGGFSLRNKSFCIKAIQMYEYIPTIMNEDEFFSLCGKKLHANIPHHTIASKFSCELTKTTQIPFGFHKNFEMILVPNIDIYFDSCFT
jgi:hypothetical protein